MPIDENDFDFKEGPLRDILLVPDSISYDCFEEMPALTDAFMTTRGWDTLVVRKEYELLRKAMEEAVSQGCLAIVVTGQPGIGSYETFVHV